MVTNVTSLTGNGLKDWLIQRITAVYFAAFSTFMLVYLISTPGLTYQQWADLFHSPIMKVAFTLAVVALSLHSWIGIWTVTTDYLKSTAVRLSIQMLVLVWLSSQFIWALMIVWGQ